MKDLAPNLFIIGAMKSGTTSLHQYLNLHPDIYMSDIKEPGYFVEELSLKKGEDWYLSLFKNAANAKFIGESSTHYTKLPTYKCVPERIRDFCKDPRFIYIMRDPIERSISHYWHNVRKEGEHRTPIRAVKSNNEYIDFSDYAMQLAPYIKTFGQEKIYIMSFESLISDPDSEINQVLTWLGLDSFELTGKPGKQLNKLPSSFKKAKGIGILYRFRRSRIWDILSRLTPKPMRRLGVILSEQNTSSDSNEVSELRQYLESTRQRIIDDISRLTGKNFPEWESSTEK